jgi:hypothetical protein
MCCYAWLHDNYALISVKLQFKRENRNYPILMSYLNHTFLRLQSQEKISYSDDGDRACFNTGLQSENEKDIYATFFKNRQAQERMQPNWTLYSFADSYSEKLKAFPSLPDVATYIEDASI